MLVLTGCGAEATVQVAPTRPAEPQHLRLGWRESYPSSGQRLRFAVDELTVRAEGWSAKVAVTNATRSSFELGADRAQLAFGLMLFRTGDLAELEEANRQGRLPAPRVAVTIEPAPPDVLTPGATWRATLSAPGSLADGSWVRVTFGPLRAIGDPPPDMDPVVFWITDRSHQL